MEVQNPWQMRWAPILVCWMLLSALAFGQALSVKGNAVQGGAVFVLVSGVPECGGEARWVGQTFRLGHCDKRGRLRALLPVPVDAPCGEQTLTVRLGEEELHKTCTIAPRHFLLQRLSIPASTLASYDDPQNRADDEAILKAARKPDPVMRWSGGFSYPVRAPETAGFGGRRIYNGWKKSWHKGLDLGGREGEAVRAPAAGKVVHTARGLVNGNTIVISHGCGLTTLYYHLQSIDVDYDQSVDAGQAIGTLGGTGGFSPHLHWEVRIWGVPVDPKSLFQLPEGWR